MLLRAVHAQGQAVAACLEAGDHMGESYLHHGLGSKRYASAAWRQESKRTHFSLGVQAVAVGGAASEGLWLNLD